ncbi:FkbM family methyltransferase [Tenacibaculum sp. MEBiC06402]|uniref:FkbM family methyltransferase n=1 Tax=unclassified Tenacibaculum TaxID=2635139 RepID=UPI003B9A3AE1
MDLQIHPTQDLRRRLKLFNHFGITKILDVGANAGQYAQENFKLGFKGHIISFEPLKNVYQELEKKVIKSRNWNSFNYALGDENKEIEINVSENTFSSSILEILPSHVESAPNSKFIKKEDIIVKKLDDIYEDLVEEKEVVLLKIDVQGFEKQVLEGAIESLKKIKGIQVEMSVEELYQGEMIFSEMISYLNEKGFSLHSLENGFYNENTGKLLQVDGIFFRE